MRGVRRYDFFEVDVVTEPTDVDSFYLSQRSEFRPICSFKVMTEV